MTPPAARANKSVGTVLAEHADLLALTGADPFKVRVYEKAARDIAGYHTDVGALDQEGLEEITGVGKSIAAKIFEVLDATAQRGWVGRKQVVNTWPIGRLRRFLAKGPSGR